MTEVVAIDIGGTHVRFAVGQVKHGRVLSLGPETIFKTADHASLQTAWRAFGSERGGSLPRAAGIAFAGPVRGERLKLTNNPWTLQPALLRAQLDVDELALVNDFGAVAHAVAQLDPGCFLSIGGPADDLPAEGVITIVGPGTGLGVAQLVRWADGYRAIETEGGHVDFAPLDAIEDRILADLRTRYRRVSVERIVSGMGLANLHAALAAIEGRPVTPQDDKALWAAALEDRDSLAAAALDRFCMSLGAVAGDLALAHGASAVVIAGGLGLRLADHLPASGFMDRFVAKGRFERRMEQVPVKLITHAQPGLFGAAAAFAKEHE